MPDWTGLDWAGLDWAGLDLFEQGAFGTAPWYALNFLTLYLERRLSHHEAAVLRSLFDVGTTFGTPLRVGTRLRIRIRVRLGRRMLLPL